MYNDNVSMTQQPHIGYSVYDSTFEIVKNRLPSLLQGGSFVFTSTHIPEELDRDYANRMRKLLSHLHGLNARIICDVSPRTLDAFQMDSILRFQKEFGIDVLRVDYGFSIDKLVALSREITLCVNASTVTDSEASALLEVNPNTMFLHNFYPRPETGLDVETFGEMNERIRSIANEHEIDANIACFIGGGKPKRGPLHEGLPTLERHRTLSPYISYLELVLGGQIRTILIGDGMLGGTEQMYIDRFREDATLMIPAKLEPFYAYYYNKVFTVRPDSPRGLRRFSESRAYATPGEKQVPRNCIERTRGSITLDNENYLRYSGELMLTIETYPQDDRVNVIGHVDEAYLPIIDLIANGAKCMFVEGANN